MNDSDGLKIMLAQIHSEREELKKNLQNYQNQKRDWDIQFSDSI